MNNASYGGSAGDRRLAGLLGMARRAGRLASGFDAAAALISSGKAYAVLAASDISEKTAKELRYVMEKHGYVSGPLVMPLTKDECARAIGSGKPVGVIAVGDAGFAASAKKLIERDDHIYDD